MGRRETGDGGRGTGDGGRGTGDGDGRRSASATIGHASARHGIASGVASAAIASRVVPFK